MVVRLQSDSLFGGKMSQIYVLINESFLLDRPWDKSTRAVVYELPDVSSPAGLFN
jgi:hypothetical protein